MRPEESDDTCIEAMIRIGLRYALTYEACIQPFIQPNRLHELNPPSPYARPPGERKRRKLAAAFELDILSACYRPLSTLASSCPRTCPIRSHTHVTTGRQILNPPDHIILGAEALKTIHMAVHVGALLNSGRSFPACTGDMGWDCGCCWMHSRHR